MFQYCFELCVSKIFLRETSLGKQKLSHFDLHVEIDKLQDTGEHVYFRLLRNYINTGLIKQESLKAYGTGVSAVVVRLFKSTSIVVKS